MALGTDIPYLAFACFAIRDGIAWDIKGSSRELLGSSSMTRTVDVLASLQLFIQRNSSCSNT